MIKKVAKHGKHSGSVYMPKRYVGKYVSISILSDKEAKEFNKLKKEHEKAISNREKELKNHLKELKKLRGY